MANSPPGDVTAMMDDNNIVVIIKKDDISSNRQLNSDDEVSEEETVPTAKHMNAALLTAEKFFIAKGKYHETAQASDLAKVCLAIAKAGERQTTCMSFTRRRNSNFFCVNLTFSQLLLQ